MKKYICKIIRIEYNKKLSQHYENEKKYIDIIYINPETFSGMCARRYHTVYCDKKFLNDKQGQYLIKEIFEPMATLKDGNGIIFI